MSGQTLQDVALAALSRQLAAAAAMDPIICLDNDYIVSTSEKLAVCLPAGLKWSLLLALARLGTLTPHSLRCLWTPEFHTFVTSLSLSGCCRVTAADLAACLRLAYGAADVPPTPPAPNPVTVLRTLSLHGCFHTRDADIRELLPYVSAVTSLDLSCCHQLGDATVVAVGAHLSGGLTALDLSGCWQVSDLASLHECQKLSCLQLSGCWRLAPCHRKRDAEGQAVAAREAAAVARPAASADQAEGRTTARDRHQPLQQQQQQQPQEQQARQGRDVRPAGLRRSQVRSLLGSLPGLREVDLSNIPGLSDEDLIVLWTAVVAVTDESSGGSGDAGLGPQHQHQRHHQQRRRHFPDNAQDQAGGPPLQPTAGEAFGGEENPGEQQRQQLCRSNPPAPAASASASAAPCRTSLTSVSLSATSVSSAVPPWLAASCPALAHLRLSNCRNVAGCSVLAAARIRSAQILMQDQMVRGRQQPPVLRPARAGNDAAAAAAATMPPRRHHAAAAAAAAVATPEFHEAVPLAPEAAAGGAAPAVQPAGAPAAAAAGVAPWQALAAAGLADWEEEPGEVLGGQQVVVEEMLEVARWTVEVVLGLRAGGGSDGGGLGSGRGDDDDDEEAGLPQPMQGAGAAGSTTLQRRQLQQEQQGPWAAVLPLSADGLCQAGMVEELFELARGDGRGRGVGGGGDGDSAGFALRHLTSLDMSGTTQFSDMSAARLATCCPRLASLALSGCCRLSDEGLSHLGALSGLTHLDLSNCAPAPGAARARTPGSAFWRPAPTERAGPQPGPDRAAQPWTGGAGSGGGGSSGPSKRLRHTVITDQGVATLVSELAAAVTAMDAAGPLLLTTPPPFLRVSQPSPMGPPGPSAPAPAPAGLRSLLLGGTAAGDATLQVVPEQLTRLELQGCRNASDLGVLQALNRCPGLQALKLSGCSQLSAAALGFSGLAAPGPLGGGGRAAPSSGEEYSGGGEGDGGGGGGGGTAGRLSAQQYCRARALRKMSLPGGMAHDAALAWLLRGDDAGLPPPSPPPRLLVGGAAGPVPCCSAAVQGCTAAADGSSVSARRHLHDDPVASASTAMLTSSAFVPFTPTGSVTAGSSRGCPRSGGVPAGGGPYWALQHLELGPPSASAVGSGGGRYGSGAVGASAGGAITDAFLVELPYCCPLLRTVRLRGGAAVTDVGATAVLGGCRLLRRFGLTGCTNVTDVTLGLALTLAVAAAAAAPQPGQPQLPSDPGVGPGSCVSGGNDDGGGGGDAAGGGGGGDAAGGGGGGDAAGGGGGGDAAGGGCGVGGSMQLAPAGSLLHLDMSGCGGVKGNCLLGLEAFKWTADVLGASRAEVTAASEASGVGRGAASSGPAEPEASGKPESISGVGAWDGGRPMRERLASSTGQAQMPWPPSPPSPQPLLLLSLALDGCPLACNPAAMLSLLRRCPHLQDLTGSLDARAVVAAARHCPNLRSLRITSGAATAAAGGSGTAGGPPLRRWPGAEVDAEALPSAVQAERGDMGDARGPQVPTEGWQHRAQRVHTGVTGGFGALARLEVPAVLRRDPGLRQWAVERPWMHVSYS